MVGILYVKEVVISNRKIKLRDFRTTMYLQPRTKKLCKEPYDSSILNSSSFLNCVVTFSCPLWLMVAIVDRKRFSTNENSFFFNEVYSCHENSKTPHQDFVSFQSVNDESTISGMPILPRMMRVSLLCILTATLVFQIVHQTTIKDEDLIGKFAQSYSESSYLPEYQKRQLVKLQGRNDNLKPLQFLRFFFSQLQKSFGIGISQNTRRRFVGFISV